MRRGHRRAREGTRARRGRGEALSSARPPRRAGGRASGAGRGGPGPTECERLAARTPVIAGRRGRSSGPRGHGAQRARGAARGERRWRARLAAASPPPSVIALGVRMLPASASGPWPSSKEAAASSGRRPRARCRSRLRWTAMPSSQEENAAAGRSASRRVSRPCPCADEGLLGDVLGVLVVAHEAQGHSLDPGAVDPDQVREGRPVTPRGPARGARRSPAHLRQGLLRSPPAPWG